ncbi:MAG: tRNA (N6-threonylcarbamoyladenosine(37)-N6)-methyltransferase TrmO [Candidatus Thorarchaeota archaeon]
MSFNVYPIGHVEKTGDITRIRVERRYCEALLNLHRFSHAIVLWWIDKRDTPRDRSTVVVVPKAHGRIPEKSGVFACRSPARPNPIGHSVVRVLSIDMDECVVVVDQIDAYDGTSVIDIKPYMPSSDRVDGATVAPWFDNLDARYTS